MKAYIAFNTYDAEYVDSAHKVPCKGFRPKKTFVPLKEMHETALQSAMDGCRTATNLEMAEGITTWFILEMTFSASKTLELFQSGALHRMDEGWRYYGDLPRYEAESWVWFGGQVPAIGMMPWACKALKSKQYSCVGSCIGCNAMPVPVWTSSKVYGPQTYCCNCWHSFLLEGACKGTYEQMEENTSSDEEQIKPCG